jgi:hypothetical protein
MLTLYKLAIFGPIVAKLRLNYWLENLELTGGLKGLYSFKWILFLSFSWLMNSPDVFIIIVEGISITIN